MSHKHKYSASKRQRQRKRLIKRDGLNCYWCKHLMQEKFSKDIPQHLQLDFATIEHLIPLSLGGENIDDNLCLACKGCNEKRIGIRLPPIWRKE